MIGFVNLFFQIYFYLAVNNMPNRVSEDVLLETYFQISKTGLDQPLFSYAGNELLSRPVMANILHISKRELDAYNLALPASFFANTLFGLIAVMHYNLAWENKALLFPLSSFAFQAKPERNLLRGALHILRFERQAVSESNREAFLKDYMFTFYQQTLSPLIEQTAESAGIHPMVLWSQYGGRMRYIIEFMLQQNYGDSFNHRLQKDYELLCGLEPAIFNGRKNPFVFRPRYVENPWQPDQPLLLRSSCCLYDQREHGETCYNCPKLPPWKREMQKERIKKEISAR